MNSRINIEEDIKNIGDRPFRSTVVKSPWENVLDVEEIHKNVRSKIKHFLNNTSEFDVAKYFVITGPSGSGKSHLVSWIRKIISKTENISFVYIPSYKISHGSFMNYILQNIFCNLFIIKNEPSKDLIQENIINELAKVYDFLAKTKEGEEILGIKKSLFARFIGRKINISEAPMKEKKIKLLKVINRDLFIDNLLTQTTWSNDLFSDRLCRDSVYMVLYFLLDQTVESEVEKWFMGKKVCNKKFKVSTNKLENYSIKRAIVTLIRLVDRRICLVFDEMENTYHSFEDHGAEMQIFKEIYDIADLYSIFFFDQSMFESVWKTIKKDKHLQRRFEEEEIQRLSVIKDIKNAKKIVKIRLQKHLWEKLKKTPPSHNLYYPLSEKEIEDAWKLSGKQMDFFIKEIGKKYKSILENKEVTEKKVTEKSIDQTNNNNKKEEELLDLNQINTKEKQQDNIQLWKRISREKIRTFRTDKNWSQKKVGNEINYSSSMVSKAESGYESIGDHVYEKLAELYKCKIDDFLEETK